MYRLPVFLPITDIESSVTQGRARIIRPAAITGISGYGRTAAPERRMQEPLRMGNW